MIRLLTYFAVVALIASGLAWLADRPGTLMINWQGYDIETSVFQAVLLLVALTATGIFLWTLARTIWNSPAVIGDRIVQRRKKKGLDALSSGMIAIGAGDKMLATRYAQQARKTLPHEPLTHLLRAQAANLSGDRATARRIYEAMLASPETEQLGLRGLYLEAEREGAGDAALQFAERAMEANPQLSWCSEALLDLQCRRGNWSQALETLAQAKRNGSIDSPSADRKRAVILTAMALELEETESDRALAYALEAHGLATDLIPAAAVAGRIYASRGSTAKAAKIIQKTWTKAPHPDLATAYAFARVGDSTRDRLDRVKKLATLNPHSIESPIAVATAAIESRLFSDARNALQPLLQDRLTQRVATLMAQIEAGENGDKGKVREWLARAVNAARDPVWMADGVALDHWQAVSPVEARLDTVRWQVPTDSRDAAQIDVDANRLEALLAISSADVVDADADMTADASGAPAATVFDRADAVDADAVTVRPSGPAAPVTSDRTPGSDQTSTVRVEAARPPVSDPTSRPTKTSSARVDRPTYPLMGKGHETSAPATVATTERPSLFVAPRAPDDPGPNDGDDDVQPAKPSKGFKVAT